MSKFKKIGTGQSLLFGFNVEDFISEKHLARLVEEIVNTLDTSEIEKKYSEIGQNSFPPKIMISILFYGYSKGIFSSRKIGISCHEVLPFMYLSKLFKPNFRTISDFRKNNIKELGNYFVEILKYCNELGITDVGKISIDGSKFRANASSKRTKTIAEYKKWEDSLKTQIKELTDKAENIDAEENNKLSNEKDRIEKLIKSKTNLKEKVQQAKKDLKKMNKENKKAGIKKEAKINLTDKDSKFMKQRNGVIKTNYNAQIAVTDNNIIVSAEVTTEANDQNQLKTMIETTEKNTGEKVNEAKLDSGYASYENYKILKEKKIDGYMPDKQFYNDEKNNNRQKSQEKKYANRNFKYDKELNKYICPEGKDLNFYRKSKNKKQIILNYKCNACSNCPAKEQCCPKVKNKVIQRNELKYLQDEMREKLKTKEGKQIYLKRMNSAESPFGHFKSNLGFVKFSLRTIEKVKSEWKLLCGAYNIMKIFNLKQALGT
jgi:transposase